MNAAGFPQMYEQHLVGPLFRPFAAMALERLALTSPRRVLDVACGTGIVARLVKEKFGDAVEVVGIDVSQPMLDVAAERSSNVDWRVGSAEALPVAPQERFDAVICQQGLQFFRDKPAACQELRRVLADDGRVAVAVWRSTSEMPELALLQEIAEKYLGPIDDQRYGYGGGDADVLTQLLGSSGFRDVDNTVLRHVVRIAPGARFIGMNAMAFVGMSSAAASFSDAERTAVLERIVTDSLATLGSGAAERPFECSMSTNLATARA
jgi:ubiquinone/menaquinone biosynthesis C-methylase UbiE